MCQPSQLTVSRPRPELIAGADLRHDLDALFVNPPLRDYRVRERSNDYTLPVLGMAYIATYAKQIAGFNVGVLDAEAYGLALEDTVQLINSVRPRWVGLNLLAPTYEMSARIATALDPQTALMAGGHHARALPGRILQDPRMRHLSALIIGEAETRVSALLHDVKRRTELPQVFWREMNSDSFAQSSCSLSRSDMVDSAHQRHPPPGSVVPGPGSLSSPRAG